MDLEGIRTEVETAVGATAEEAAVAATASPSKAAAAQSHLGPLSIPGTEEGGARTPDLPPASPELAFRPTQEPSAELVEGWGDGGEVEAPEGYYPRSKSTSPVQRKIREMEVRRG